MQVLRAIHKIEVPKFSFENGMIFLGISIVMWLLIKVLIQQFIKRQTKQSNSKFLIELSQADKIEYEASYFSIVHSIVSVTMSLISMFLCCEEFQQNIFNDEQCFQNPLDKKLYLNLISAGYFILDFFVMIKIGEYSSLTKQLFLHHFLSLSGIIYGQYLQGVALQITQITFINEFSAIFTNLRLILLIHKQETNFIYILNGFLILVTFFLFRIVFQTFVVVYIVYPFISQNLNLFYIIMISLYSIMHFLNLFWFTKIYNGFIKAVKKSQTKKLKI